MSTAVFSLEFDSSRGAFPVSRQYILKRVDCYKPFSVFLISCRGGR